LQLAIGDEVLLVLDSLVKRAAVTTHLDLSPAFVDQCVLQPQWFGLDDVGLSLQTLYFFSQYAATVRLSAQPEERLLDYLQLINTLWDKALEGDKRLIRDSAANRLAGFLDWGVRQVLAVAFHLNPEDGVIFTLAELDLLVRTCRLARHTDLDAEALLALGTLTPTSDVADFRHAAELALASLTQSVPGTPAGEVGQSHSSVITVTPDYLVANKSGESATYSITLRDFMDEPFEDVTITWSTNLGVLEQRSTVTDENGESSVTLESGDTMGIAHVVAEYGLGDKVLAPVVTIGCDEASLHFSAPTYDRSEALSNKLEAINFSVTLVDDFTNLGIDRLVEWGTTLGEFQRYQTMTNHEGISHSSLRSGPLGEAAVIARYENGSYWAFPEVTFTSTPYFQYIRFASTVVEDVEVELSCRLVELNGDAVPEGTSVTWRADAEDLLVLESATNSEGIALSRFKPEGSGTVTVTVSAQGDIKEKSTEVTKIYPQAVIARYASSQPLYMEGDPNPVVFSVWLVSGGDVSPRTPVEWKVDGVFKATTLTDKDGLATFNSKFIAEHGAYTEHSVSAAVAGTTNTVEFQVFAAPYFKIKMALAGAGIYAGAPDLISKNAAPIVLNVQAIDGAGRSLAGIPIKLLNVGTNLNIFNLRISPLDVVVETTVDGYDFSVVSGLNSSRPGYYGDITLRVETAGIAVREEVYRVGLIYYFSRFAILEAGVVRAWLKEWASSSYLGADRLVLEGLPLTVEVAEASWRKTAPIDRDIFGAFFSDEEGRLARWQSVRNDGIVLFDGYVILVAMEILID